MSEQATRERFRHWITVPVRWGDMDAFGHVNNARYFTYCESARISYFQAVGLGAQTTTPDHGPSVVTATCNFRRQVHYPATLEVGVRALKIGRTSFPLEYGIFLEGTGDLVADGSSVVVWVDYGAGKSTPLPESLKARIRELDGL
jgi:acyl-CoA thioester hydrolase